MTVSVKAPTSTTGSIQLNGSDVLTIDSSGNLTAENNLTIDGTTTATGSITGTGGIYLGGIASANLLDDYEEGSWTPALTATTAPTSVTYVHRTGRYRRIGDLVYVTGAFQISARSGGSGQVIVDGLPFNVSDELPTTAVEAGGTCAYFGGLTVAKSSVNVWAFNNSTKLYFTAAAAAGSTTMPDLNITDTSSSSFQLRFTISYITDA